MFVLKIQSRGDSAETLGLHLFNECFSEKSQNNWFSKKWFSAVWRDDLRITNIWDAYIGIFDVE